MTSRSPLSEGHKFSDRHNLVETEDLNVNFPKNVTDASFFTKDEATKIALQNQVQLLDDRNGVSDLCINNGPKVRRQNNLFVNARS